MKKLIYIFIHIVAYALLVIVICCSCSQTKTITETKSVVKHVAHDTLTTMRSDSIAVIDTRTKENLVSQTDSVIDRMTTYIVVDSAGAPIKQIIYRDRQVYHNRDALSSNSHSSATTTATHSSAKKVTDCKKDSLQEVSKTQTKQKRSAFKDYFSHAMLVLWAVAMLFYFYLYKKRK